MKKEKKTAGIKEKIIRLFQEYYTFERMCEDIDRLSPRERVEAIKGLMEYIMPRRLSSSAQRSEIKTEGAEVTLVRMLYEQINSIGNTGLKQEKTG